MRVSIVIGTRPQIIKSQPIIAELQKRRCETQIIHTGQHYDYQLSKTFFDELKISEPDINLGIKEGSPVQQLSKIISKLEKQLYSFKPDFVIVPGDTRSALAAAICSWNAGFKVVHVEAGARSMDFYLEEEINRRIIDSCSALLFAPTKHCLRNLQNESILGSKYFVGDTMYDVFLQIAKKIRIDTNNKKNYALITLHRKNNIENIEQLKKIITFISDIKRLGMEIIFPIHPHTKKMLNKFNISTNTLKTIEPVRYSKMLKLLSQANLLVTDSGGLQKEAYWLNVPTVTLRPSTEWVETLKSNKLFRQIDNSSIVTVKRMLAKKTRSDRHLGEFGDGKAAQKIVSILFDNLKI